MLSFIFVLSHEKEQKISLQNTVRNNSQMAVVAVLAMFSDCNCLSLKGRSYKKVFEIITV
jgi:hypothetical protein